jgi:hypothetical protein
MRDREDQTTRDDKYYYVIAGQQQRGVGIKTRHAIVYRKRKMLVWRSWRVESNGKIRVTSTADLTPI